VDHTMPDRGLSSTLVEHRRDAIRVPCLPSVGFAELNTTVACSMPRLQEFFPKVWIRQIPL